MLQVCGGEEAGKGSIHGRGQAEPEARAIRRKDGRGKRAPRVKRHLEI